MEEPDIPDSGEDDQLKQRQHIKDSDEDSDSPYSDSDTEESTDNQKSMYNVHKPGHVPGKYKENKETKLSDNSSAGEFAIENSEQDKTEKKPMDESLDEKTMEGESDTVKDDQVFKQEEDLDFAETGIFGKSMLIIPSLQKDEDTMMSEDTGSIEVQPELTLSSDNNTFDQVDKRTKRPDIPPKPALRKSKCLNKDFYSEKQLHLTDELSSEKKSPLPSPRMIRKAEEEITSSGGTEPELENSQRCNETNELEYGEINTNEKGLIEKLGDSEEVTEEEVDTVDIGSAQDSALNTEEKSGNSFEDYQKQDEEKEEKHLQDDDEQADSQFQKSVAISSFEVVDDIESFDTNDKDVEKNALLEDSESDTDNASNFVNDLKETDSGKSDVDNDQDMSDSEPEGDFQTPENQSLEEKENEIFYDSKPIQSVVGESTSNEDLVKQVKEENAEDEDQRKETTKNFMSEVESKEETVTVKKKIRTFEDSVVVIGKGTIKDSEYESMSSMIDSDDLISSAFINEGNDTLPKEVEFGSIDNKISMFEFQQNKNSCSYDFVETSKSCSSSSSFDVLTKEESEDSEKKSDVISTSLEDIVMEETDDVQSEGIEKNKTFGSEQHILWKREDDSFENDMPPPIAEKSEKVLESMKSMFVDVPNEDDRGAETSVKDGPPDDNPTLEGNFTEQNNTCDVNRSTDIFNYQQNLPYQQDQQTQPYPNMGYNQQQGQFQQQQQFPPNNTQGWNQPYNYYLNQGGNFPYAFYNPNMNPGIACQTQDMQYFQQPYFPHQNFGMQYRYTAQPDTEPFRSHCQSTSPTSAFEETGQQTKMENLMPHDDNIPNRPQSQHTDHHKEVSHPIKPNQGTPDVQHGISKLRKSKFENPLSKNKASSSAVKKSVSMPSKTTPVSKKRAGKKKDIEKKMQAHKEEEVEESKEEVKNEDYYVYFKDINPETKRDNLSNFVEVTTGGNVLIDDIIYSYTRTCALVPVSLDHKPDLHKVKERIQNRGLDTKYPEVFEVPKPTKIAVSCEEDINNKETLDLYFESRKAQGDEPLELKGESYESEGGSCFVLDFGDTDVVKRICSKERHAVEGKSLRVSPYFDCEGGAIWNTEIHVLKVPDSIHVKLESNYLIILKRECCAELVDNLEKNNCSLEFTDTGIQLHCTLTPKMTGFKSLAKQWEETSRSIVDRYIGENIIERPLRSTEQVWNELIEFFNSENVNTCEEIVAVVDNVGFIITFIGFDEPVKEAIRKLEDKQADIERQHRRKTETIRDINDLKLRLLKRVGVFDDLKHNLQDIGIDIGDREITIEGQPEDINEVRIKLYDLDNRISKKKWNHQFSRECVFFVNNVITDQICSLLQENKITAVWKMDENVFEVYAFEDEVNDYEAIGEDCISSDVCLKAEQLLKSAVVEMKEPVQDSIIEVLTSPEWISFSQHITETYEYAAELEVKDDREILVHGMKKEAGEVHTNMKDFLDKNAIISDTLTTGTVNIRFIRTHRQDFVKRTEMKLEQHKVKIELRDDSIKIRGNKRGILEAKKEFKIFFDAILFDKHTIQKVAVKNVFKDHNEQGTIEKIEKETCCLIKIPGENATFVAPAEIADELEDSDDGYEVPRHRGGASGSGQDGYGATVESSPPLDQCFKAQNGVTVILVKGELGQQDGNVIVVTTSPNLNLSSGNACKSVLREGGPQLQNECKEKYPNEIKFGEIAVLNGGGKLECNKVYLTTLPNWNSEHNPEQVLKTVMKDSLELAEKHNKYSIVFCAMGTGQLQYPTEMVAKVMYQAVIDFAQGHPQSSLKEVKFVLYQKDFATIKAFEEEERFRVSGGNERPKYELKTGNVTIELLIENIAQQKVDAILCSTSPNMELSKSGACQALVRVGGKTLQEECKSKYSNKLEEGNVVEIGGGKLSCKSVYLTVLPAYNADAIKILTKVIQALLQLTNVKGYQSVALPALGTGFLRYPRDEVCQCMFQTVIDWVHKNPASSITTVKFIMYAKDHGVIERFRSHILNERGRGRREHRRSCSGLKPHGARPKKTPFDHTPKKPQTAVYNAHDDGIHIGKIKLSVFKDDILSQKTDAIVSSVGRDFKFIGAVAHELTKRCPKIEEECQKKENLDKLNLKGVVMTKGQKLPAKHIIHVKFAENIGDWQERILKCLETADKKRLKSIAFPILGTGKGFKIFSPEAITGCLFDAVNDFIQKTRNPSIKEILLIVYRGQPAMYAPVMDKLHKKVQEAIITTGYVGKAKGVVKATVGKLKNFMSAAFPGREEGTMSEQDMDKLLQETSSLDVLIYSDSKTNIERCKKALELELEKSYTKKKIEDYKEIIKTLKPHELDQLDITALANINIDNNAGIITIEGPSQHVSNVLHTLQMRLLKIERQRNEASSAEELYKLVQWQYEEVTEKGFKYTVYEKGLNQKIENAYKANSSTFEFEDNDGETFVIDFNKLEEYKKSDDQDRLRVVRKDILKAVASALPEEWADMKDNENIKVVSVPNTDKEYQDIETRFIQEVKTGSYSHRLNFNPNNLKVNKIERIQNRTLYQQYQAKKNQMKELKPNLPATLPYERDLWHGTKYDAVTSIQMHGFNRSYSGNANGDPWYGEGVYFAGNASYSARGWLSGAGAGSKGYMFVVKTLTGQLCQGKKGMRYLPQVDPKDPTILYDCAVDNLQNPLEFVIFNDTQAYPAYIITFTT